MTDQTISAIIITLNEADNLPKCLETLKFCHEVIVLDQQSPDQTAQLAEALGARVITTEVWSGFGLQKQRALDAATGDWILSIDADERVTPELAIEIQQAIQTNHADGYYINRRSQFLGKWMHHGGWYPDRILRLAKRAHARFDPTPIHEKMLVNGKVDELTHPLLHYSYRSIEDVLSKQKTYALASGRKKLADGQSTGIAFAIFQSAWTFTRLFILQLGFLDGRHGLVAAMAKSQETFWKYLVAKWPGDRSV
jgi:glycosyltransferase involved in cell wall biosynthesis